MCHATLSHMVPLPAAPAPRSVAGAAPRCEHTTEGLDGASEESGEGVVGLRRAGCARASCGGPTKTVRHQHPRPAPVPVPQLPPAPVDDTVRLTFPHRSKDTARAALKVPPFFVSPRCATAFLLTG